MLAFRVSGVVTMVVEGCHKTTLGCLRLTRRFDLSGDVLKMVLKLG